MADYSFLLDDFFFSYSSISSFESCNYNFFLNYIQAADKIGNFFSDFGSFVHKIWEKYLRKELTIFELSDYYKQNYSKAIVNLPPPFPRNMWNKYKDEGQLYFDFFGFDIDHYDILLIEEKIKASVDGINVTIKPDAILKDKNTGETILLDIKTTRFVPKADKKKLIAFKKQMFLYTYFINLIKGIKIDKINLLFIRSDHVEEIIVTEEEEKLALDWFLENAKKIKTQEEFPANNSAQYFCQQICSVRRSCTFKDLPVVKPEKTLTKTK